MNNMKYNNVWLKQLIIFPLSYKAFISNIVTLR